MQTSKPLIVMMSALFTPIGILVLLGLLPSGAPGWSFFLACTVPISFPFLIAWAFARQEYRLWNGGTCSACKEPWRYIARTPFSKTKGYICGCPGNSLWFDFSEPPNQQGSENRYGPPRG